MIVDRFGMSISEILERADRYQESKGVMKKVGVVDKRMPGYYDSRPDVGALGTHRELGDGDTDVEKQGPDPGEEGAGGHPWGDTSKLPPGPPPGPPPRPGLEWHAETHRWRRPEQVSGQESRDEGPLNTLSVERLEELYPETVKVANELVGRVNRAPRGSQEKDDLQAQLGQAKDHLQGIDDELTRREQGGTQADPGLLPQSQDPGQASGAGPEAGEVVPQYRRGMNMNEWFSEAGLKPEAHNSAIMAAFSEMASEEEMELSQEFMEAGLKAAQMVPEPLAPGSVPEGGVLDFEGDHETAARWHAEQVSNLDLNRSQLEAVGAYTGAMHLDINSYMRGEYPDAHPYIREVAGILEGETFQSWSTPRDMKVYRGAEVPLSDFKEGQMYSDRGFISTSLSSGTLVDYAPESKKEGDRREGRAGIRMHISAPKGTPGILGEGNEIILKPDTKFMVNRVVEGTGGTAEVHMTVMS